MRKILKEYYQVPCPCPPTPNTHSNLNYQQHVCHNPHTLISRIFGLHRVKLPGNRKIHFVVMGNVFPPNKDIHETFDLKGSLIGRELPEEECTTNARAVMKDLNWLNRKKVVKLGPEKGSIFVQQMERDVAVSPLPPPPHKKTSSKLYFLLIVPAKTKDNGLLTANRYPRPRQRQ